MHQKTYIKSILIGLITFGLIIWSQSTFAQNGQTAVQNLVMLFSAWSDETDDSDIFTEAAKYIDYAGMAKRALGSTYWEKLSPTQQTEFVSLFRRLVEQQYYPRWHKIFYNGRISYEGQTTAGSDILAKTILKVGNEEDTVIWRLHPKNGELMVISLSVDETDLLLKLNDRFKQIIEKKGFNNLLAWMKDKLDNNAK